MVINAKKISDVVLVYDQYYAKKPNAALLLVKRVALCCALCLCAMMFLLAEYDLPVSSAVTAVQSVLFSAGFSLLFSFVKKRFAIPSVLALGGLIVLFIRESFMYKLSYFMDALWLLMDGRFVPGRMFTEHELDMLNATSLMYCEGVELGFGLIVFFFTMITAACMFVKPRILPSFFVWVLLWLPVLISEKFTFSVWIIPALALYMSAIAYCLVYSDGTALCGGKYKGAVIYNEQTFEKSVKKAPLVKQIEMRSVYYSKYQSLVMYVMAVFAALGIVAGNIFDTKGIDYTPLYEFVRSIEQKTFFSNPFEQTQEEDWFTNTDDGEADKDGSPTLSIATPGRGNAKILSVTNPSDYAVYLRGDIGIRFEDNSWTSPVKEEPPLWKSSGLAEFYRPAEVLVLNTLQNMADEENKSVAEAEIEIEYLRNSTVTFLPAYTMDFGYFDSEMFTVYGDFVIRASEDYDRIDSVKCTALVPVYTNMDDSSQSAMDSLTSAAELATAHGGIADVINSGYFPDEYESLDRYREYVESTYLEISDEDAEMINNFLFESGLKEEFSVLASSEIDLRYKYASMTADYLRSNYTYSLNAENGKENPLEAFLTETKSGHCALYASAMTLAMRSMGIPARYCTGFVVTPNDGEPTILRSKNLHAWCEVYLNELGWVTFDPTSSSQTGSTEPTPGTSESSSEPESSDESTSSEISSESSEPASESSENSSSSEVSSENSEYVPPAESYVNIWPYIFIILVISLVSIVPQVLIIRFYDSHAKKAVVALKKIRASQNSDIILGKILLIMEICGFTPSAGEMPDKFYARAEEFFGCSITDYKEVLEESAFSRGVVDKTECARLAGLLERLYVSAERRSDMFDKIKLRRAIASKK